MLLVLESIRVGILWPKTKMCSSVTYLGEYRLCLCWHRVCKRTETEQRPVLLQL